MGTFPSDRRLRGAATLEAILALSVLVIIWAGVAHMGSLYAAELRAKAEARKCAWMAAVIGCGSRISGCASTEEQGDASKKDDALVKAGQEASGGDGLLAGLVREPLMTQLTNLFGSRTVAHAKSDRPRPRLLGGGQVTTHASYSLPCNTKNESATDMAERAMTRLLSGKGTP